MPQSASSSSNPQDNTAGTDDKSRVHSGEGMATSYGFQTVKDGQKQPLVNAVFDKVASRYDVMNDLMSGGLHRVWKNALVAALAPPSTASGNWRSLDVAGGTGDIALRIVEASRGEADVTVLDINASMLEVGESRASQRGVSSQINFVEGNAESLPFDDNEFNAYTIAFGIRNVPHIEKALAEAFRVLKPGGRFLCLEFSAVDLPVLDKVYDRWSMQAIPTIGQLVTGDGEPYKYLVESVRKFPDQQAFATMISQAGFETVNWRNYTGGIAALHSGWKI